MKFIKYASMAAAVAMMASCSSDNLGGGDPDPIEPGTGVAYLNIGLALSDNQSGRGYDEGKDPNSYDTGEADEYDIKSGVVYIFVGTGDADAYYVAKGIFFKDNIEENEEGNQLSTKPMVFEKIVINDFDVNEGASYLALVILNPDENIRVPKIGESFLEWSKEPVTGSMVIDSKYICMSNATKIENGKASTLVKIESGDIQKTEFTNQNTPSTNIYVQRNVAKVSVVAGEDLEESSEFTVDGFTATAADVKWVLDVKQTTTYPVMNYTGLVWTKSYMHSGWTTFDRAFWAVDPNYDDAVLTGTPFTTVTDPTAVNIEPESSKSVYCLENTMKYDAQYQDRTTRVIIKATWKPSKANYDFEKGFFYVNEKIYDANNLKATVVNKAETILNTEVVEVTMAEELAGGNYSFDEVITSIKAGDEEVSETQKEQIAAIAFSLPDTQAERIAFYSNNVMYYAVRIRHFTDTELYGQAKTPFWTAEKTEYEEGDLGRYGVVRNNSYSVEVAGIAGLGTPGIPEIIPGEPDDPTTPDDPSSKLRANINILSWAKRSQSETLGGN